MLFGKRYIRTTIQTIHELKVQFIQSVSPKQTALSVTIGFYIGIFPIVGLTTVLCILITSLFKANHLISVAVNLLVAPLQVLLIIPFMKIGQALFNIEPQQTFQQFDDLFLLIERSESWYFLTKSVAGGIVCWAIFSASTSLLLYRFLVRRFITMKNSH